MGHKCHQRQISKIHKNTISISVQGTLLSMIVKLEMIVKLTDAYDLPKLIYLLFIG